MKISQAASSTLLVAITEAVQHGTASEYGSYKFPENWEQKTLDALGEDFSKSLLKAMDGSSLEEMVQNEIRLRAVEAKLPLPKTEIKIVKLKPFTDALGTARAIVARLESVPIQYRMIVRVAGELAERVNRKDVALQLSDRLRLLSGAMIPQSFKLKHDNEDVDGYIRRYLFPEGKPFAVDDNALYLEYRTSGYLTPRRSSRTVGEFLDEVRSFYGACIAFNIMSTFPNFTSEITPIIIANSIKGGEESFVYVQRAEEDVLRCANLSTAVAVDKNINAGTSLENILEPIKPVFNSDNSNRLKTACAWALRAHLSTRSLDKVLEATITIEVLVGDRDTSDRIGLSKLMANRCAYALGRSNSERDQIVEFFVRFYKLRSEVVHSGRTSLHADERRVVEEGLSLATKILKHEIALAS